MRYTELLENQDDNDMFGASDRVDRDLRRATFTANIPEMIRRVQQGLLGVYGGQAVKEITAEFFREANFMEKEELQPLARELFTHDAPQHLRQAFDIVSEDPAIIEDEDRLADTLMTNNIFTNIRNDSELWAYATEMMEEFAEGDEELEYHLAMEIEGTVGNLIVRLMQQAFAGVRALGEDTDDLFSDRPNGKLIAQDIELWLRRRQNSSRRPPMPSSVKYVQEVIAAFNRSFLEGVKIWSEYPLYGNTDIKYDIREYLENSQNVNLMDYVQQ